MPAAANCTLRQRGFTLLELMIMVAILGIVAAIGVPNYMSAVLAAKVGKAKHELVTIANAIDSYRAVYGRLPLTLYQVGFGGRLDPWGVPYCYLNYGAGSGDGLAWAVELGIVDPSAFGPASQVTGSGDHGTGSVEVPPAEEPSADGQTSISSTESLLSGGASLSTDQLDSGAYDETYDDLRAALTSAELAAFNAYVRENGDFSLFVGVQADATRRRDRYMFPLNTDYDLFSLGPDARTSVSLGDPFGLDDVIRANDGGYFGSAEDY